MTMSGTLSGWCGEERASSWLWMMMLLRVSVMYQCFFDHCLCISVPGLCHYAPSPCFSLYLSPHPFLLALMYYLVLWFWKWMFRSERLLSQHQKLLWQLEAPEIPVKGTDKLALILDCRGIQQNFLLVQALSELDWTHFIPELHVWWFPMLWNQGQGSLDHSSAQTFPWW